MNTKRYRKRKTAVVPMSTVRLRESHANKGIISRHRRKCYPLFESWNSIYNFKNLMESLIDWEDYSTLQEENVKQVGRLLQEVEKHGSKEEIDQATRLVCEEVLSYLKNPRDYANYFSKVVTLDETKQAILDHIHLLIECDRVTQNYKLLEEKYNMNRLFIEACNNWGIDEAMNRLCDCMEAYEIPDFKTRFCVTVENALYGLSNLVQEYEIPQRSLIEAVIDYHLVNDGCNDTYAYFKEVRNAIQESLFIPDIAEPYLQFLESVRDNERPSKEKLSEHYQDPAIQAIAEYDDYLTMQNSIETFYEMGSFDDAKRLIASIKLSPSRNLTMIKDTITQVLENVKDGVGAAIGIALKIAFFVTVVVGAVAIVAIAAILGTITICFLSKNPNEKQLKVAIDKWKAHRSKVQRKLNSSKNDQQKKRIQAYLKETDRNIAHLTKKYEEVKNKTANKVKHHKKAFKEDHHDNNVSFTRSAEADPSDKVTSASSVHQNNSLINAADRKVG